MDSKSSVGVIGLGHIGGSIALSIRDHSEVLAFDPNEATMDSAKRHGIDTVARPEELLGKCGTILFAPPNPALSEAVSNLLATRLKSGQETPLLVVDVASTKIETINSIAGVVAGHRGVTHLSLHPMAGREGSGFDSSDPEVLFRSRWAEIPTAFRAEPGASLDLFEIFSLSMDFEMIPLSAAVHDKAVAVVSHLPHVLAEALGVALSGLSVASVARRLAAGSFGSATRVANGTPERIAELCWANRNTLATELDSFIEILARASGSLKASSPEKFLTFVRQGSAAIAELQGLVESRTESVICRANSFWATIDPIRDSGKFFSDFKLSGDSVSFVTRIR
ncbi:MAG: prephenate dehydrogenase/arogenate dehydrogenase family protein [Acidimicrobiaceae bacterium]|nr:prephenate dehydrogenase/arogenate dehydrogenase family protein [Acidimicrobiaceae bacterium]